LLYRSILLELSLLLDVSFAGGGGVNGVEWVAVMDCVLEGVVNEDEDAQCISELGRISISCLGWQLGRRGS
jgi:hypothetical protein